MSDDENVPDVDPEAIARAEAIIEGMRGRFLDWLQTSRNAMAENLTNLLSGAPKSADRLNAIQVTAHELKGMGGTFGYPLVTRVGGSLEQYLIDNAPGGAVDITIIQGHVAAISEMVTAFKKDLDPQTETRLNDLLEQLETRLRSLSGARITKHPLTTYK